MVETSILKDADVVETSILKGADVVATSIRKGADVVVISIPNGYVPEVETTIRSVYVLEVGTTTPKLK